MTIVADRPPVNQPSDAAGPGAGRTVAAISAATVLFLFWSLFIRASTVEGPISLGAWNGLSFDPYYFGLAAQELAIPLLLVLIFSRTALFRRTVAGRPAARDGLWLLLVLVGMQVITFFSQLALARANDAWITYGLFLVFVAGMLGGWRMGALLGVLVAISGGLLELLMWDQFDNVVWAEFLEWYILKDALAMGAIWLGVVVGLARDGWPRVRSYAVDGLLGLGLATLLFVSACAVLTTDDPSWLLQLLLSGLVVSLLAIAAFAVMARGVQTEAIHAEAEATMLALAQANLSLTQTRLALAEAELRALHAQINPHFFFNSLNTIRYFIRTDPDTARTLLTQLSEIFQRALSAGEFVALRDEISHVEAYLALEQARLEERLRVIWTNLAKRELDHPVPTLILQPLVENAVIHGLAPKPEGGTLHIVLNRVGDDLLIQVDDDGMGFDVAAAHARRDDTTDGVRSIGLRNVDERLQLLYGPDYGLVLESTPGKGTRAVVRIPLTRPALSHEGGAA